MAGHLSNHPRSQTENRFGQKPLDIAAHILDFIKDSFNALALARQEAVQCRADLVFWVGTAWGPKRIADLIKDLRLPVKANEALVAKDIAENKVIDDRFGCLTLIGIGRQQVIAGWNAPFRFRSAP